MTIKTIIIIVAVIILLVGICSGPKGRPRTDRERGQIDHLLRSAHDTQYWRDHTTRGRQSVDSYNNKMKKINNQYKYRDKKK